MGKKLIVCCDGTGNEIEENHSNVLKFYKCLKLEGDQVGYYDPGVGTIARSGTWSRLQSKAKGVFGLATGAGLDDNVLDAYRFLVHHYEEDAEIFLFGFSRGAYTVRVLAGLLHMLGLCRTENENLLPYALTAYKRASESGVFADAWRFTEMMRTHRVTVRFMGCWDTVASMIVPRPDRMFLPSLEVALPFTTRNPSVQAFRHAISIDERRRMFRLMRWEENQLFKRNPFLSDEKAVPQDCEQVWFAGVHSDIGGGYPEAESAPAKYPLRWMIDAAEECGLVFRAEMVRRLVNGRNPAGARRQYSAPSATARLHESLTLGWKLLEALPKRDRFREWPERKAFLGLYLPWGEPRFLPKEATLHESVKERQASVETGYAPPQLESRRCPLMSSSSPNPT